MTSRRGRSAAPFLALVLAVVAAGRASAGDPPKPEPRWLAGDMHVHVSPPDEKGHSALTVASAIAAARKASLDFIVLTPHDADRSFPDPRDANAPPLYGQELEALLAAQCLGAPVPAGESAPRPLLAVAGWEYTRENPGHLGLSFFKMPDLARAVGDKKAEIALANGATVVVNHPFFRPVASDLPIMKMVTGDRGWRPFLGEGTDANLWNAIEVWHERSVLVQRMHAKLAEKFPDTQMVTDSLAAWDKATREQKRRIVAVGGSDCHGRFPYAIAPLAMMSVRVDSFDEEALHRGIAAGHVTFGRDGGPAARDFAATSDVAGAAAIAGDSLAAKAEVRLTWSGKARLVEDGQPVGEFDGGAARRLTPPGSFHAWRIEKPDDAYSNMIYANLP